MFTEKKTNNSQAVHSKRNLIGSSTKIIGDITSDGDFRLDGTIDGNVKCSGKFILGKEGVIKGTVVCNNADIEGKLSGKLTCNGTLSLKASSVIDGEVFIEKLAVEPGATLNATCNMKGVKSLKSDKTKPTAEKSAS